MNLPRLLRTVRHLRPVQLYGRLLFALPHRVRGPIAAARRARGGTWQAPIDTARSHLGGARFALLGEQHSIETPADWQRPDLERLWLYNLHYFDDLRASDSALRRAEQRALMLRWVRENPPARGVGWEPYPSSLRIANWIKWALAGGELGPELERSLALQAEWLSRRIEHHLQGNHLLANAKALVFAGLFFEGEAARRWLRGGARLLERQLSEQILSDGGHCERSPMYHALVLEDLLDLINLSCALPGGEALDPGRLLEPRIRAMRGWLARMLHPDGEIAFFNDAALGVAARPAELDAYAGRLGIRGDGAALRDVEPLSASGYVRARRGDAVLIADVGEIGPEHLTGHAHADTLSFELSLRGRRVIVNSGTSRYGTGAERQRQRSTPAHNTVAIDGENSSEVWSGFRVGRRAHPFGVTLEEAPDAIRLCASHDGYRHLRGRPVHERSWCLREDGLEVIDRIHGEYRTAVASCHFAPELDAELDAGGKRVLVSHAGRPLLEAEVRGSSARLEAGTHHPRFSSAIPNRVLRIDFGGGESRLRMLWSRRDADPVRD